MIALKRIPAFESLAVISVVSLTVAWGVWPYLEQALAQQGTFAQHSALVALWISAIIAPFAALMKAAGAATVCWAVSVFLNERLPLVRLIAIFCVAETVFCMRDLGLWFTLAVRGVGGIHSTADLVVPFGLNTILPVQNALSRVALESWDLFHIAWSLLLFALIRLTFRMDWRTCACLSIVALLARVLFAAAGLLYAT